MADPNNYALDDKFLNNNQDGGKQIFTFPRNPFPGWVWAIPGMTQYQMFNPTCKVGKTSLVMLSVNSQLGKDNYKVTKVSESIEVMPHHAQYYQLTIKQREELEAKVREGLIRISQSLSDLELLEHDIRKYRKYLQFIKMSESSNEKERKQGEMVLKTIFVDQVDYYAGKQGQGPGRFSMALMRNANIFPTIVDDFMEMAGTEDLGENGRFARMPVVEKHFLEVKWKYYEQWKAMFKEQIKKRLSRLEEMRNSRMKSLEEFKSWVYPYLFRLKSINVMTQDRDQIPFLKHFFPRTSGDAFAITTDKFWAWRGLTPAETFRTSSELVQFGVAEEQYNGEMSPYNDFTKRILIFSRKYGLINKFPWITKAWVKEKVDRINAKYNPGEYMFWTFVMMDVMKVIVKYPPNIEIEDVIWDVSAATLSSNALLVKLLELEAIKEELLFYVDEMLGITPAVKQQQSEVIGYVEEGGRYCPVKDGDYVKPGGKKVCYASLYDLENNAGKLVNTSGEKPEKYFPDAGNAKLVEAEVYYYSKKKNKFIFFNSSGNQVSMSGINEFDSIEHFKSAVLSEAKRLYDSGKWADAAFLRAFLVKPKPLIDFGAFLDDIFGIKFRKYRMGGRTPYERDFMDRITQYYLVPTGARFGSFLGLLYSKYGVP